MCVRERERERERYREEEKEGGKREGERGRRGVAVGNWVICRHSNQKKLRGKMRSYNIGTFPQ